MFRFWRLLHDNEDQLWSKPSMMLVATVALQNGKGRLVDRSPVPPNAMTYSLRAAEWMAATHKNALAKFVNRSLAIEPTVVERRLSDRAS